MRRLRRYALFDVLDISVVVHFAGVRQFEGGSQVHVLQQLRNKEHVEIRIRRAAVPAIRDVAAVEDLTEKIKQIGPGNVLVLLEVVVQNSRRNREIPVVKRVSTRPTLRAEALAAHNKTVEETKPKETGLELARLAALVDGVLIELVPSTAQVGLNVLRGFVGDFDALL